MKRKPTDSSATPQAAPALRAESVRKTQVRGDGRSQGGLREATDQANKSLNAPGDANRSDPQRSREAREAGKRSLPPGGEKAEPQADLNRRYRESGGQTLGRSYEDDIRKPGAGKNDGT